MKANAVIEGRSIAMTEISTADMDILLRPESYFLKGIPTHFDELGRIWPIPEDGIEVEWIERRAHKVMTAEEYAAMPIIGWHEVCRDVDGFGGIGIRYLGL